ncbi:MAG TPA: MFS transporter, partial [Burkholderiales bacterium]|nr:MFS transporter [Burkholderiales bacterium]
MSKSAIAGVLGRALDARSNELPALFLSFAYFFCLLCGYYILRPLREEMGIAGGVQALPWTFTATFLAMVAVVPLFGWITKRFARAVFLPLVYLFFIVNLLLFFGVFQFDMVRVWTARVFFVWLSVFNLFVVSVFWSVMVDLYTNEQGRRLFGFIAAGGSIGAIAGPALTATLAVPVGPVNLLLVSAVFLAAALLCVRALTRIAASKRQDRYAQPLGGSGFEGVTALVQSRYLLGVALFVVGLTVVATFVYFEQAHIVSQKLADSGERTRFFASIDLAVNVVAVSVQMFGTGRAMRAVGLTTVLALMPLVAAGGLALLGALPLLGVLAAFQIVRRAGDYALTRPARELLFTVVTPIEKYRVKNVIDTLVYRGGDAIGAWAFAGLTAIGFGLSGVAFFGAAIALIWFALAL